MSSEKEEKKQDGEEMAPEEEKVTSSKPAPGKPCAGCKHLRRRCAPGCVFAPYFSPDDTAEFAAVHLIFGAANLSKLLAEIALEDRAEFVESLVFEAVERQRNPTFGCVSHISLLQNVVGKVGGELAAAREELAGLAGPEEAIQPFDPASASPEAKRAAEVKLAAALRFVREQDDQIREKMLSEAGGAAAKRKQGMMAPRPAESSAAAASMMQMQQAAREQASMMQMQQAAAAREQVSMMQMQQAAAAREQASMMQMQQAAAAQQQQQQRHTVAQEHVKDTGFVQGPLRHWTPQQLAGAQTAEQDARMRWEIAAGKQKVMPQTAAAHKYQKEMAEGAEMGIRRQAAAEDQFYHAAMAQAQQLATAEEIARDPHMMMTIRQAAAAAGLTMDQYMMMMTMPQRHGQEGHYTGIRLTGDQNMTTMHQAQQYGNMGMMTRDPNMTMMPQQPANAQQLAAAAEELMLMQQQAAADCGVTIMSYLPEESANADAFLVPQQSQTVNPHSQEEACLAPLPPWLAGLPPRQQQTFRPGGSANADAFLNQQQRQNVQVQEEQSLPPLARWPHQQQTFLPGGGGSVDAEAFLFQQQQQPLPQTVNTQFQEQSSLPPWLAGLSLSQRETFLTGGASANSEAFLFQQQLQQPPQLQMVNVLGSQVEPSLPPSQAGLPGQQQNDGGDQDQSIDLVARYWNQFPNLPPDGRQ
ncbi:hypothetical protein PR202_ga28310 [Eleusine coracana subsp. coracana]|uniref:LOB domain-containing protein n=1 Tax=Eleusine coracana subsp. coracana TaxID=191504 RepID=A0AAV5DI74_ELECO|nr:hypothetical protein PR202_ga28310 [Eleusine coracana subsp. coracana]